MNHHPNTTPASPSLASPLTDAAFDSIETLTTSFATSAEPLLETTTVTEVALGYHRNQQYSITDMTTSTGVVAERYAYTAYGQPTILNASGSPIGNQQSQIANRFTYTGREWDETLGLHHFRARWMSPLAGRFMGRDPIGYWAEEYDLYEYVGGSPGRFMDPYGLCTEDKVPKYKLTIKSKFKRNKDVPVDFKGSKADILKYKGTHVAQAAGYKDKGLEGTEGYLGLTTAKLNLSQTHTTNEMDCEMCCPKGGDGRALYLVSVDIEMEVVATMYYLHWTNAGASQDDWNKLEAAVRAHESKHIADARKLSKEYQGSVDAGPLFVVFCPSDGEDAINKKKEVFDDSVTKILKTLSKKFDDEWNFLQKKFHDTPAGKPIYIPDYIK